MRKLSLVIAAVCLGAGAIAASAAERVPFGVRWVREFNFSRAMLPVRSIQRSSPVVSGATVYLGSRTGEVRAYRVARGGLVWRSQVDAPVEAGLVAAGDHVYAATISGTVYALRMTDGSQAWSYQAGHEVQGDMAVAGDRLVFATGNNQVYALGTTDGHWLWQYNGGEDPDLSIRGAAGAYIEGGSVYTGFSNGVVARLDLATGKSLWAERWREESRFNDVDSTPVVAEGAVYAVLFGSRLLALNADKGGTRWTQVVQAQAAPLYHDGKLYLGGLDGVLRVYRAADGQPLWQVKVAEQAINTPALSGDWLVVTGTKSGLWVLDRATGESVWHYTGLVSGTFAPPTAEGKTIFVASNLGHLLKITPFWR